MKKLIVTTVLLAGVCVTLAGPAVSQPTLGVYFDAAGTQRTGSFGAFEPFYLYVIAKDMPTDIAGYEFRLTLPPEWFTTTSSLPAGALNAGTEPDYIVAVAPCVAGGETTLLTLSVISLGSFSDYVIGLVPPSVSSFSPPSPGYTSCSGPLIRFECWETGGGGEAILNPVSLTPSDCQTPTSVPKPQPWDADFRIFPNPFNPRTTVGFTLAERGDVRIAVYDVRGALVRVLVDESLPGGEHVAEWNGVNMHGQSVASGVYFARMVTGRFESTRKMVLLK